MPNSSSVPQRVSFGYILGFSDKPYKDPKPPPPPPRPRRPSQLTELIASPGGLVEWTASDGRKGRLTGMGKLQLTAASLAKVPSNIRSTKDISSAKEHSKNPTSKKPTINAENLWTTEGWDNIEATGGFTKSTSKKAPSHKNDGWGDGGFNASVSNNGSQKAASCIQDLWGSGDVGDMWVTQANTPSDDTKKDEKEDEKKAEEEEKKEGKKDEKNDTKATGQANKSGNPNETPAPTNTATEEGEAKKPDNTNTWTKEQDDQLLQMKTENAPWKTIQDKLGKPDGQCKARWIIVKPAGWKPVITKNNSGKGNASQKKNTKLDEQKQNQGTKDSNKEKDKKDTEFSDNLLGDPFVGILSGISESKQGEAEKAKDVFTSMDGTGDSKDKDPADLWGPADTGTTAPPWDDTNQETNAALASDWGGYNQETDPATPPGWDTTNQETAGANAWDIPVPDIQQSPSPAKPASAPRSTKAPSESCSHRSTSSKSKPSMNRPVMIELEPDDTFSADDLRLIARILQQDCSMVWSRLSWRFRDKTGKTVHPSVFEKKITGTVKEDGKGSERDGRKK